MTAINRFNIIIETIITNDIKYGRAIIEPQSYRGMQLGGYTIQPFIIINHSSLVATLNRVKNAIEKF